MRRSISSVSATNVSRSSSRSVGRDGRTRPAGPARWRGGVMPVWWAPSERRGSRAGDAGPPVAAAPRRRRRRRTAAAPAPRRRRRPWTRARRPGTGGGSATRHRRSGAVAVTRARARPPPWRGSRTARPAWSASRSCRPRSARCTAGSRRRRPRTSPSWASSSANWPSISATSSGSASSSAGRQQLERLLGALDVGGEVPQVGARVAVLLAGDLAGGDLLDQLGRARPPARPAGSRCSASSVFSVCRSASSWSANGGRAVGRVLAPTGGTRCGASR